MFSLIEKQSFVGVLAIRGFDLATMVKEVVVSLLSFLFLFHLGIFLLTGEVEVFIGLKGYVLSFGSLIFDSGEAQRAFGLSMQYINDVKAMLPAETVLTFSGEQLKVNAFQAISLLISASAALPLLSFAGSLAAFVLMVVLLPFRLLIDVLQAKDVGGAVEKGILSSTAGSKQETVSGEASDRVEV